MSVKQRLIKADHFNGTEQFNRLTAKLNTVSKQFFQSQIECSSRKIKGRRFSIKDKITALALYKQSPVGYRLLSQIFALPSRVTLTKLLQRIPIKAGICSSVFEGLRQIGERTPPIQKYCVLLFDEMSLMPHVQYNQYSDEIEGFEDFGERRTDQIADHVQVYLFY